jgi:hypothetical protein
VGPLFFCEVFFMKTRRAPINKGRGARQFRHEVSKTHPKNMQPRPMRGGIRL